jgi:hypothetical protein
MKLKRQLNEARKLATPRTAILWGPKDLLGEAIESLLTTADNWLVIRMYDSQDVHLLPQEVERVKPEIVIIHQGHCTENFPPPIKLIENFPELKIITINPENNLMEVYNKQIVCIKGVVDLLSTIGEQPNPIKEGADAIPTETCAKSNQFFNGRNNRKIH